MFQDMKVGDKFTFKPVQRGIMLTTKSYIELTMYLMEEKGYTYVLGGRLTTDCAENVFSAARIHHQILNALQFKRNIRAIGISQYLRPVGSSLTSYEQDDRPMLNIDLDALRRSAKMRRKEYQLDLPPIPDLSNADVKFGLLEPYDLYHCAGYIMSRIDKFCKKDKCQVCMKSAGSKDFSPSKYSKLTELKRFTEKKRTLFFINDGTYDFFFQMEIVIRQYLPYFMNKVAHLHYDLEAFFYEKLSAIQFDFSSNCKDENGVPVEHDLKGLVIKRFTRFRLSSSNYTSKEVDKVYNSKTVAMHAAVK